MDKEELLIKHFLKNRSEKNFLALYHCYNPQIYPFAFSSVENEVDATELIQEMWVVAIKKLPSFGFRSTLKTWLIGILINLVRDRNRKKERISKVIDHNKSAFEESDFISKTTIHHLDIKSGLSTLPDGYRQIFVLHDIEGYTHKEIANLLNISEGTSKSQLHHARNSMKKFLNNDYLN